MELGKKLDVPPWRSSWSFSTISAFLGRGTVLHTRPHLQWVERCRERERERCRLWLEGTRTSPATTCKSRTPLLSSTGPVLGVMSLAGLLGCRWHFQLTSGGKLYCRPFPAKSMLSFSNADVPQLALCSTPLHSRCSRWSRASYPSEALSPASVSTTALF